MLARVIAKRYVQPFLKMTPTEFIKIWTNTGDKVIPISPSRLHGLDLKQSTIEFLIVSGLPDSAAPMLSFIDNSDDSYKTIGRLTHKFDFLGSEFDKYICIGSCSDGDPVVINTDLDDQIEWLDHDDNYTSGFFNSSIESLAECLIICRDFVSRVQKENGQEAFINGYFTDDQFEKFKSQLIKADNRIFMETGFWKEELEMYMAMRDDFRKNR